VLAEIDSIITLENDTRYLVFGYSIDQMDIINETSVVIPMDSDRYLSWYWISQYLLNITSVPEDLPVVFPKSDWWNSTDLVELNAPHIENYKFQEWIIDGTPTLGPVELLMNTSHWVSAVYQLNTFEIMVENQSQVVSSDNVIRYSLTIDSESQIEDAVLLNVVDLPSDFSATFEPAVGVPPFISTLILTVPESTTPDTYVFGINAQSSSLEKTRPLSLTLEHQESQGTDPFSDPTTITIGALGTVSALASAGLLRRRRNQSY